MTETLREFFWVLLWGYTLFLLLYFVMLNVSYLVTTVVSFFSLRQHARRMKAYDFEVLFEQIGLPPVTLLAGAYNEEKTCVDSVNSILQLRYPSFEVIFINDGSSDRTFDLLKETFDLIPGLRMQSSSLPTRKIRGVYRSRSHPALWVIDKENGGRSDALNAGINLTQTPLVCTLDADTMLERDAIHRLVRPFLEEETTVAAGGIVRIVNGCRIEGGRVMQVCMPRNLLAGLQVVEYLRSFLSGRVGWNALGMTYLISGAFGMFRRPLLVEIGGYNTATVGEDMELVLRIHHHCIDQGRPYRVTFVPDPVAWTECPQSLRILSHQRNRWQRGLLESLLFHRGMFGRPRYGVMGCIAFPYLFFLETLGPAFEVFGYGVCATVFAFGKGSWSFFWSFLLASVVFGMLLSASAVTLEELTFRRYVRVRDLFRLFGLGFLENLGYRQLTSIWRCRGIIDALLFGKRGWGRMERKGFSAVGRPVRKAAGRTTALLLAIFPVLAGGEPERLEKQAEEAYRKGDRPSAIRLYEEWVQKDPGARLPRIRLAQLHRWAGSQETAERLYRALLAENPGDQEARTGLGHTLMQQGNLTGAEEAFAQVLEGHPEDPDALLGMGQVRLRKGNWTGSREALERGLAHSPDYRDLWLAYRRVLAASRPEFSMEGSRSVEKEYDQVLRDHVVKLQSDRARAKVKIPWSAEHTTSVASRREARTEQNLRYRRLNYDVDRAGQGVAHRMKLDDAWQVSGSVEDGVYTNNGTRVYNLDGRDRFLDGEVSLTRDEEDHVTTLGVRREELLIKDFSNRSLRVIALDGVEGYHFWDVEGPAGVKFIARGVDYELGNERVDLETYADWQFQRVEGLSAELGWAYRAFEDDVAEYYSFDRRSEASGHLAYRRRFDRRWYAEGHYVLGRARVEERRNARRVTVSDASEISSARRTDYSTNHKLKGEIVRNFSHAHQLALEGSWSINSNDYETYGIGFEWRLWF
jgi:cellulose synthase/poly-beta-1,6-N-acetylglucosamine synthase-like glycosyltransferase/tetratricopeptide (TPR) repeat protein